MEIEEHLLSSFENRAYKLHTLGRVGVVRKVTERYIRDDITCRSAECVRGCVVSSDATCLSSNAFYYLIPDSTTLLYFLDMFELREIGDVIICQSVMEAVDKRSTLRVMNRISALFADTTRRVIYFPDKHCADCIPISDPDLVVAPEYTELEILKRTAMFFAHHTGGNVPIFSLCFNEPKDDVAISLPESARTMKLEQFFQEFANLVPESIQEAYHALAASLTTTTVEGEDVLTVPSGVAGTSSCPYPAHLSAEAAEKGIDEGLYLRGALNVNSSNSDEVRSF
eukprot:TRINITY_DN3406_c0_g1::TRINITY_DN3406_c0_g1_i1::g.20588::m.20588 TRINITY_DN3406_c0_g1::TRINITY_DN3406_c0_g1_i1::g.20588  ORF type:complete len:290 (+),score=12.53,sp/Q5U2P0/DI3L1_RAT/25.37/4e-17 TRINITY_DN3406_c0_g1_i1:22-870(+)